MNRIIEFVLAGVGALMAAPVILGCAAAIRLTSSGSAIFRQVRVGLNEQPFTCLKLRTMYLNTGDAPSHETKVSAITPVGHFLRRTKLDELPQLWNILKGEMSFVGPRPCLPSQVELIAARRKRGVYAIRPGITGVAQVAGVDMSDPERLAKLDAVYLAEYSLMTDLRLIMATLFGAGRGDRVRS
ncbi:sugar transferase [Manganibacter manganicus]|uniref:Lipid carrier--UDP-N-acetylgalactosaminyltransferase n=1 Tax=Manganibacter manganicus TaxID=1873176 RepID=A0A1V8RKV4_9HYPH|nr:sugar transferase [Pseudaminobacter manganicus]OQM73837.1 lipid carrier--UDP-N-acetylgalactosaminyltransferase [Pseudaminobacter manganicus]